MNVMRPRTDKIEISGNLLTGVFHIYIFKQDNAYIAYCPSIDLAVSGNSIQNAEESLQESMSIHLDYQIKNYVKYILVTRPTLIQSKLEIQYNKGNLSPTKNNC